MKHEVELKVEEECTEHPKQSVLSSKFFSALKNTLTGPDNKTHDIARISLLSGVFTAIILQSFVTITTGAFDIVTFGTGFTILSAGGAGAVLLKHTTEPLVDNTNK